MGDVIYPLLSKSLIKDNILLKEQGRVLSKSRWLMLCLLTLLTVNSTAQWIFFSSITHTIKLHFDVPLYAVQFLTTSGCSMVIFIIFVVPCVWIVQKTSLRTGCLINGCLNTIAAVIKYFACSVPSTSAYSLTLTGQIISSIAICFILPMPSQLAATWFGQDERSFATSMVVSGHVIGVSCSCLLSIILVESTSNSSEISRGLEYSHLCQGSLSLLLTLAVYILFKSKPPIHPSKSQAMVDATYKESLSILVKNMHYALFLIAYGVIYGAMFAFWIIAQQAIPEEAELVKAIAGIVAVPSIMISGFWLDRSKSYKSSMVLVSFLTVLTALAFTLQLQFSILGIYIISGVYGVLISSFMSMGLVFGSEITYPIPEMFSSGLLLMSSQIFAIILTSVVSFIYSTRHHVVVSSGMLTGATFLAAVLISFVKFNFKRFAKDNLNNTVD